MLSSFVWRDGVQIAETPIWCDALRTVGLSFLSHAQRPLVGEFHQLLCTERTFRLLPHAPDRPGQALLTPVGRPFSLGGLRLELFSSGFLPGAASLLTCLPSGDRVVYAGDISPRGRPLGEPLQVRAASALACHAPLAALGRPLPSWEEASEMLLSQVSIARDSGAVAILLCPVLGVAQEIAMLLRGQGIPVLLHRRVRQMLSAYVTLGVVSSAQSGGVLPPSIGRKPIERGTVLLWPLDEPLLPLFHRLGGNPVRTLVCAGAALSEDAVARFRQGLPAGLCLTAAIPCPEGADLQDLYKYVRAVEARDVYLTAGYCDAVVSTLAKNRVRVQPLGPPRQLDLFLG